MTDRNPLRYRSPVLVAAILDHVQELGSVRWAELVETHSNDHPWRTVEATLYDLVTFGAVHRVGKPGTSTRPDTRELRLTILGAAWLAQTLEPLPGAPREHTPD